MIWRWTCIGCRVSGRSDVQTVMARISSTISRRVLVLLSLGLPMSLAASPQQDLALLQQLLQTRSSLPPLELARGADGSRPLSKTVQRPDGLSLSVFAAGLVNTDRSEVRQQFGAWADRVLAQLLLGLPRQNASSPQAPGFVEYRLSLSGAQVLLAWRSDEPFSTRKQPARNACERVITAWDPGPVPAGAPPGLFRRQQWRSSGFERSSAWEVRSSAQGEYWHPMQDRCELAMPRNGSTPPGGSPARAH